MQEDPVDAIAVAWRAGKHEVAFRLVHPLAEQGNAEAQFILGVMYGEGQGAPLDTATSITWLRRAAEQHYGPAMLALGLTYAGEVESSIGPDSIMDPVQAYLWLGLAAAARYPASYADNPENLAQADRHRDLVASQMTAAQLAEAKRRGRQWMKDYGLLKKLLA